jgi:hypothetical protein
MAKVSTIEPQLAQQYGNLDNVIPVLVEKLGQEGAARVLGVKQSWISRWLKDNGYKPTVKYIKATPIESEEPA